jgi:hypothetical protein
MGTMKKACLNANKYSNVHVEDLACSAFHHWNQKSVSARGQANGNTETTHTSTVLRMPSSSPTCGSYPNTRRAFSMLCHRCAHVNATRKRVKVGSRPDNQPHHSENVASTKPTDFDNTRGLREGYVSGASMRHSRRAKSQKYTGSPLVMKKTWPATVSGSVPARLRAVSESWSKRDRTTGCSSLWGPSKAPMMASAFSGRSTYGPNGRAEDVGTRCWPVLRLIDGRAVSRASAIISGVLGPCGTSLSAARMWACATLPT